MTCRVALSLTALLLALPLLEGSAGAASTKRAKADAKAFSTAGKHAMRAIDAAAEKAQADFDKRIRPCLQMVGAAPANRQKDIQAAVQEIAQLDFLAAVLPAHEALADALLARKSKDKRLKAAAKSTATLATRLSAFKNGGVEPCPFLEAWNKAGWARDKRPATGAPAADAKRAKSISSNRRTIRSGGKRMRKLGIARKSAERFVSAAALG